MRAHKLSALLLGGLLVLAACGSSKKSDGASATTAGGGSTATTAAGGSGGGSNDPCGAIKIDSISGFTPVKADTLTIVTSLPGPGFFNGDSPEKLTGGYEYCMAKAMQQAFGLKDLTIRNENFDAITTGAVKDYDVSLSQVTITDERAKVVTFSDSYFESQQGILTKKGTKVATVDDAKKLQWAVQTGTTGELLIKNKLKPAKEAQAFQDLAAAFAALSAGQVDAVCMDTAIVLGQAAASNGTLEVAAQFAQEGGPDKYGAILPKDSKNVDSVNKAIAAMKSGGLLTQFANNNLSKDPGTLTTLNLG